MIIQGIIFAAPGFLELLLSANICMHVCVSAPKAINYSHKMNL